MALTTVDVVTNVVSGNETPKNATIVVSCLRTGEYKISDAVYETSLTYNTLESNYTDRFQNNIDNLRTVDGGNA